MDADDKPSEPDVRPATDEKGSGAYRLTGPHLKHASESIYEGAKPGFRPDPPNRLSPGSEEKVPLKPPPRTHYDIPPAEPTPPEPPREPLRVAPAEEGVPAVEPANEAPPQPAEVAPPAPVEPAGPPPSVVAREHERALARRRALFAGRRLKRIALAAGVGAAAAAGWLARDAWLGRVPLPAPTREGVPEGPAGTAWVRIPGGSFMMGAEDGDPGERPVHKVRVPTLEMARTEATVGQYAKCVSAGVCSPPRPTGSGCSVEARAADEPPRAAAGDLPVTCVDWGQARAFCEWSGGRLCSESEWAYAARSGDEANSYPWGPEEPTCERAVFRGVGCAPRGPSRPCSKTAGSNQWGACDLAGNVWEWVEDDWHDSYDGAPTDGAAWLDSPRVAMRVARGGSFASSANVMRMTHRNRDEAGAASDRLGIRCCRTPQR